MIGRLFNRRLSGLRIVTSENIYGRWKKRFPILKNMRTDLELSQKIIISTAVLHNIAQILGDEDFDDGYEEDESRDEEDDGFVVHDMVPANRRARGQVERDIIKDTMPM